MKELRSLLIFFIIVAAVIWFAGRLTREVLPGRGAWDGRTYTNEEAGIRFKVPEEYKIYTDAEIIKMYDFPEDVYKHVKRSTDYFDNQIESGNTLLYTAYYISYYPGTCKQYLNLIELNYTQLHNGEDRKVISSDKFEKVLCGQTYYCLGITYENVEPHYLLWCFRKIPGKGWVFIHIEADSEEKADELLADFNPKTVNANVFEEVFWWLEKVF